MYVGDVNSCYLPYLEYIVSKVPLTKFVVLKRPKQEVIDSFIKHAPEINPWMNHDGKKWRKVGKWDDMHPKYDVNSKEQAIEGYWKDYYKEIEKLIKRYTNNIRLFQTKDLNSDNSVKEILDFCGISLEYQLIKTNIKENRSGDLTRSLKYFFWRVDRL